MGGGKSEEKWVKEVTERINSRPCKLELLRSVYPPAWGKPETYSEICRILRLATPGISSSKPVKKEGKKLGFSPKRAIAPWGRELIFGWLKDTPLSVPASYTSKSTSSSETKAPLSSKRLSPETPTNQSGEGCKAETKLRLGEA